VTVLKHGEERSIQGSIRLAAEITLPTADLPPPFRRL
jgi:hypothetical protein